MEQRSNTAAVKVAQIRLVKEEFASDMAQRGKGNDAAAQDALILSSKEECVEGTGQRGNTVAARDAKISLRKEECAVGTGQVAIHKMNPLHLDQNLNSLRQLKPYAIIEVPELPSRDKKKVLFLGR